MWKVLISDFPWEYKIWAFKIWIQIMWNQALISPFGQTFMAIVGDYKFWLCSSFVAFISFFALRNLKND